VSVKQEQLDALKAAWKDLKDSLDHEPATREVHAAYDSMEKLIESLSSPDRKSKGASA
jgi:hypothetical protein